MIVICDINILPQGHYIGFNQYIIDHAAVVGSLAPENSEIIFLFNAEAREHLHIPDSVAVQYLDIPKKWRNTTVGKFRIWRLVKDKLESCSPDHLYFLDLDKFQFPIGVLGSPCGISGIYFRPHHRIRASNDGLTNSASVKLRRVKKIVAEKLLLWNKNLRSVFILNDPNGVKTLNTFHHKQVFKYLPDPIFDYAYDETLVAKDTAKLSLLIFGALTERKNITNLLKAFGLAAFTRPAILKIVGSCDSPQYLLYLDRLSREVLAGQESMKEIQIRASFVTDAELEIYHASADVSLLVYKDFYGSSGLLGRAAKHQMVVLAPSVGLLHDLTLDYKLGITVDPFDPPAIAKAMVEAESRVPEAKAAAPGEYYRKHSPDQFLRTLFG